MSVNSTYDGVDINEIENSEGRESVAAPDPGLSTSDEGVVVNIERLAAVAQEVGAVANGSLVNSQEDGTNRAEEGPSGLTNVESSLNTDTQQLSDASIGSVDEARDGTLDNDEANSNAIDVPASVDQGSHGNGITINADAPIEDQLVNENQDEDAGKEEMFVDAPDYMTSTDGRSIDAREFKAMAETTNNYSENELNDQPMEGENQIQCIADDLAVLHAQLDKAVAEKELVAHECNKYKEEREMLSREICDFHHQLQALSNQCFLLVESNYGLVDRLCLAEREDNVEKTPASNMPLHTMVGEFSKFLSPLKKALDEQLQSEGTVRELHAVLFTKDQDMEDLNEKFVELSVSHDVLLSYMESLQKMWTESLKESANSCLHLENFVEWSLASFAPIIPQDDVSNDSVMEKISAAEKSIVILIENHTRFLSEAKNLGQCLASVNPDFTQVNEFGVVFEASCEVLHGQKRKELDLLEKVQSLEEENQKLIEELDNSKQRLDEVNADISKTKMELEQAEGKLTTSREKLSMAVTKGKALVQQRDALRQSLNEKTNELEKCLLELQLKTSALDAAEANKEEIIKSQHLVTSLEESLSEKSVVLQELDELISQANSPEEIQSLPTVDRIRWLVNQKSMLEGIFLESCKVKDAISFINLPESVSSAALASQIDWLGKSFAQAKDDVSKLQDEIATALDAAASHESQLSEAHQEIEQLGESLSEQKLEKDSLLARLDDLTLSHNESIEKLSQLSSEKEGLVRRLLELSEYKEDDQSNDESSSDPNRLIEMCIGKIKEKISVPSDSSFVESDNFQWLQSLIFAINQELMLWKMMLEEDMLHRSEMAKQSDEIRKVSEELDVLKTERDSLQKDLERAEEKYALIREKLSMAIKKGKGLVQERENLKLSLDEKNAQIEKLRQNTQQQDSTVNELNDQIKRLSGEFIPKLEADANAMREERGQIEQLLLESNNKVKALVTSIDCTILPADIVFEDPVDKVKWIAKYVSESEVGKTCSQQILDKANEEVARLASKLADAYATIKSLEDALSQANSSISILGIEKSDAIADKIDAEKKLEEAQEEASLQAQMLADVNATIKSLEHELSDAERKISMLDSERRDAEISKAKVKKELEEVKEEAHLQNSKLADAYATVKSLEYELSEAEKKISILDSERRDAEIGKAKIEQELEEEKEEARLQNSKLVDAHATIASLSVALSEAERNISMLGISSKDAEFGKVSVEQELKKARQETDYQTSKLTDAYARIKSLEDTLRQSESAISRLSSANEEAESKSEHEIAALNMKLAACLEELSTSKERFENQSSEVITHLNHLQMLTKEQGLLSLLNESFQTKFEDMRNIGLLVQNIHHQLTGKGSEEFQFHLSDELHTHATKISSVQPPEDQNATVVDNEMSTADLFDSIPSCLSKIVDGFNVYHKLLHEKIEGISSSINQHISYPLQMLQTTKDDVISTLELMESLKLKLKNLEAHSQARENQISAMQKSTNILLSACTDAAREFQNEVHTNISYQNSMPELESLNGHFYPQSREVHGYVVEEQPNLSVTNEYVQAANDLLLSVRRVQGQSKRLEDTRSEWLTTTEELQKKLKESVITAENAMQERDVYLKKVSKLEGDLETLNNCYNELKHELLDYQEKGEKLGEKEAELSTLHLSLSDKDQASEKCFLSTNQVELLLEKLNKIDIISKDSEASGAKSYFPDSVNKLFYIIDNFKALQHSMDLLSHDKVDLRLTLEAQIYKIENMKREAEILVSNNQELESKRWDLEDLRMGMDKIVQKLGVNDSSEETKSLGAKGLLSVLEKLVANLILDCESYKSKSHELGAKLHEKQMSLDALSARVQLLQDSLHDRPALSDTIEEKSILDRSSMATGSEISEIEDVGAHVKSSIPPLPASALRTLRKGSSEHLALNIDMESDRLINHHESDDKGHVFKSLHTSILVPKQGKLLADKIDGIWVSGGRILMSRPGARISLIVYSLLLHIWVLGTIL